MYANYFSQLHYSWKKYFTSCCIFKLHKNLIYKSKYILVKTIQAKCFSGILLWRCSHPIPVPCLELIPLIRTFLCNTMVAVLKLNCAWDSPGEQTGSKWLDSSAPPQKRWFSRFGMGSENVFLTRSQMLLRLLAHKCHFE